MSQCQHKTLAGFSRVVFQNGDGLIIEVECADCMCHGSFLVGPGDVNWSDADESEES